MSQVATRGTLPPGLLGSATPLATAYDVALLDLDGVCFAGDARVPYAAQGVGGARAAGMRLSFVTNNASRAPAQVVAKLGAHDIEGHPEEIFTAAMDAAAMLREHLPAGSLVLVVGGDGVRQALLDEGFRVTSTSDDDPAAVVQGWDPCVDWALLSEGLYAITKGALHVATNLDATLPTEKGFALGNGSLVAAIANASGRTPLAGGKPYPGIYERALARAGGRRPVAVGDRLNTDHVGARAASIPGLHVLSEGLYAITKGALHVATNLDATLPTEKGFALGNGSLVAAIANASGRTPLAGGKPYPGIYERALARAGGRRPVAVGDRLNTDHVGARAASIPGLHVLTGVSTARDVVLAPPAERPAFLHTDLRGLLQPHPEPVRVVVDGDTWWQVGQELARVEADHLVLARAPRPGARQDLTGAAALTLDAYRAAASAAWAHADEAGQEALSVPELTVGPPGP